MKQDETEFAGGLAYRWNCADSESQPKCSLARDGGPRRRLAPLGD